MKRFRTKKKVKEDGPIDEFDRPNTPALKSHKTFRRAKKSKEPEPKPELDIANALPSRDDFRTSLLMSGLSARFSMLREQDDPKTKIGKASDDSVLTPKRHSRLGDFGFHHGLADIAEVASINGSIRRPFASDRIGSYHSVDGYATDDDIVHGVSVMARAKPGEGNNLFGGRQKIYKIPAGASASTRNLASSGESTSMGGRALYDDDVSQSAFQKLREREKEQREREQQDLEEDRQSSLPRRSESPPASSYNRNRETSSTTSDGPSLTRSSTAATSITSQRTPSFKGQNTPSTSNFSVQSHSQDRSVTRNKRLYETGTDPNVPSQQFSATGRLDNLPRQRALDTRSPSPSPRSNNADGFDNSQGHTAWNPPVVKNGSSPPTSGSFGAFNFGVKPNEYVESSKPFGVLPPLSPPMSDVEEQPSLPIQPNDRGKATALGTFSKPIQPYDEKKYTQRQLQMQQGRETPPLRKNSPPQSFNPNQQVYTRTRAESTATNASIRSQSSAHSQSALQNRIVSTQASYIESTSSKSDPMPADTLLDTPSGSDVSLPRDVEPISRLAWGTPASHGPTNGKYYGQRSTNLRSLEEEHPAHRQTSARNPRLYKDYTETASDNTPSVSISEAPIDDQIKLGASNDLPADSPTLGPGLSGMVRQHLRSDSNSSSHYGSPSPGLVSRFPGQNVNGDHQDKPLESQNWEQDYKSTSHEITQTINEPPLHTPQFPSAFSDREYAQPPQEPSTATWEKQITVHHTRDGSTETQKERREFANELATRRRQVQKNLRSFAESDNRSESPVPGDWLREGNSSNNMPQGGLKLKQSRGSLVLREGQSKAMKMLGMGNSSASNGPRVQRIDDSLWKQEEEEMLRGLPKSPRPPPETKAFRQARRDAQRDRERQVQMRRQKEFAESEEYGGEVATTYDRRAVQGPTYLDRKVVGPQHSYAPVNQSWKQPAPQPYGAQPYGVSSQERKGSVPSSRSTSRPPSRTARDRSSSDASGRSKSRNGRYRDDLAKAMAEGIGSSAQGSYEDVSSVRMTMKSPAYPAAFQNSPSPSPAITTPDMSRSNGWTTPVITTPEVVRSNGRSTPDLPRNNGRTTPAGYFESLQLQPIQTNHIADLNLSPRPSPVTPFSANATPALIQPSPIGSALPTPTGQGFQSQGRIAASLKRPVNKSDISDPTLVSTTSRITTVTLPAAAAMQAQFGFQIATPPLAQHDPRRMQTRAHTMYRKVGDPALMVPTTPSIPLEHPDETSAFSADEADQKHKLRQKLRKSSSDGGNLHVRARQTYTAVPSPALPVIYPSGPSSPEPPIEGGMF